MRCSVVIPCHNEVELTRACIASLLEQDLLPSEILIVDNASSDDTAYLGAIDPSVRVIQLARNRGFGGGVNAGLLEARGDHVLILNNDTQAAPNLLRELFEVLHSSANIGACAPVSNHVKGDAHLLVGACGRDREQRQRLAIELQCTPARVQDVDTLAGLCLLLRTSTIAEVGLFDERFGHGNFEDDDFCLRLRLRGYRLCIARRAFLHHEGHATFQSMGLDLKEQIAHRLGQFRDKWQHHPAGLATLSALHHNYARAAQAATRARRQTPAWLDADWHIGRHHERLGDSATAIRHLRAFLRHCPEHVEARLTLALALLRHGQRHSGQAMLSNTLKRHQPTPGQERRMLQRLGEIDYQASRFTRAIEHFHTALQIEPDSAELHNWVGLCELGNDNLPAAITAFQIACEHGHKIAHSNLGICQSRLGEHDDALQSFEQAVVLLPHDPVARANYEAGVAARAGAIC